MAGEEARPGFRGGLPLLPSLARDLFDTAWRPPPRCIEEVSSPFSLQRTEPLPRRVLASRRPLFNSIRGKGKASFRDEKSKRCPVFLSRWDQLNSSLVPPLGTPSREVSDDPLWDCSSQMISLPLPLRIDSIQLAPNTHYSHGILSCPL